MKKIFDILNLNKSTSILVQGRSWGKTHTINQIKNMENLQAADYFKMIENGELPTFVSAKDRERITELYSKGEQWSAVRKLMGIVESQNNGKGNKSFA